MSGGDSLVGCGPGSTAIAAYHPLATDRVPRFKPSNQSLLLDLSDHPGWIPRHDRVLWHIPRDD